MRCADRQGLVEQWISASEGFIQADVIRWTEGIYAKHRRKNAKSPRLGERLVTAQVLEATDDGWLKLLVLGSVITKDDYAGSRLPHLSSGEQIKRARKTVERGKPERLLWSDESARSAVRLAEVDVGEIDARCDRLRGLGLAVLPAQSDELVLRILPRPYRSADWC